MDKKQKSCATCKRCKYKESRMYYGNGYYCELYGGSFLAHSLEGLKNKSCYSHKDH